MEANGPVAKVLEVQVTARDARPCGKCQVMMLDDFPEKGACPVGGGHKAYGYLFGFAAGAPTPTAETNWFFCDKCYSLFLNRFAEKGICPAGGGHEASGPNLLVPFNGVDDHVHQTNWRFCDRCYALFFNGSGGGVCPAGGAHLVKYSFDYVIDHWTDEPQDSMDNEELKLWLLVNGIRTENGLPQVEIDVRLVAAARAHSQDLANNPDRAGQSGLWRQVWNGFPGHVGSDGSTPPDRIERAVGSPGGENVYVGWFSGNVTPPSPQDALNWWVGEPSHKANILNPSHRHTGLGIAYGDGVSPDGVQLTYFYFTQDFMDA
ncbi:hypothetical protein CG747_37440 [Streptomyces sp. CB02959]|uniref:CAP domain-containing protein n=1 Tax=Streptomyces sp. CB02959 TaxID=2020330 RepID=UPI000C26E724|nr:CAP domain-containing protein [Streptomyces sp. CB02959]PJN35679.1 hypothetical protein CG747_37440 [Streptomyces sp. CB02959]